MAFAPSGESLIVQINDDLFIEHGNSLSLMHFCTNCFNCDFESCITSDWDAWDGKENGVFKLYLTVSILGISLAT